MSFMSPGSGQSIYGGVAACVFVTFEMLSLIGMLTLWIYVRTDDLMVMFESRPDKPAPIGKVLIATGNFLLTVVAGFLLGGMLGYPFGLIIYNLHLVGIGIELAVFFIAWVYLRERRHRIALMLDGVRVGDIDQEHQELLEREQ